jgi:hypothetical protein
VPKKKKKKEEEEGEGGEGYETNALHAKSGLKYLMRWLNNLLQYDIVQ